MSRSHLHRIDCYRSNGFLLLLRHHHQYCSRRFHCRIFQQEDLLHMLFEIPLHWTWTENCYKDAQLCTTRNCSWSDHSLQHGQKQKKGDSQLLQQLLALDRWQLKSHLSEQTIPLICMPRYKILQEVDKSLQPIACYLSLPISVLTEEAEFHR